MKPVKYMMNKAIHFIDRGDFVSASAALDKVEVLSYKVWFSGDDKPKNAKIKSADKAKLNRALEKAGFDGNGRFKSISEAHGKLTEVLREFGMEFDDVLDAWQYKQDSGKETIHYAFQTDDPFWPVSIDNSLLDFSWHLYEEIDKYEILCYAS